MSDETNPPEPIEIDVEALRRRYDEERLKRLRPEANAQFHEMKGEFARFADDPYADPNFTRDPVTEEVDALIIGGGFGGLLTAGRLREQGVDKFRIVDRAGDFGGTWYWNRYPGIACDVESYIYLPMLEETGYVPTEKYAKGAEIFAYCQQLARRYDLYGNALFHTVVNGAVWNEDRGRWIVSTDRGDQIAARFLVSAKGLYTTAKLPGIPGIESFQGKSFHTWRWDYDYTGGDSTGAPMVKLHDKTVGVIGTGSTSLQCVPHLGAAAKQLYVIQRTPGTVAPRGNRPTDPEWAASLEPGWRRRRMENFTLITAGVPQPEDMVDDGWTDILREISSTIGGEAKAGDPADMERAQFVKMEKMRRRIEQIVKDKATAEALKPYYHYLCKRPGFSDEYLDTFNLPNVTLLDTAGKGVERITPKGVVVAGREYALDCLIYATGFDSMTEYTREAGFDFIGPGGLSLSEHWSNGTRTLYAMQTSRFPNLFLLHLIQAGISFNYMHIAEEQAKHIAYVIGACLQRNIKAIEPSRAAEDAWVDAIVASGAARRAFLDSCTPGYINHEGRRTKAVELNAPYPPGPVVYIERLEKLRAEDSLEGFDTRGW